MPPSPAALKGLADRLDRLGHQVTMADRARRAEKAQAEKDWRAGLLAGKESGDAL